MVKEKHTHSIITAKYCGISSISYEIADKIGDKKSLQLHIGQLECLKQKALEELKRIEK